MSALSAALLTAFCRSIQEHDVARAARVAGIPYAIIEMIPETVRSKQAQGEPIYYGDSIHEAVLQQTNIKDVRIVVIAINDPLNPQNYRNHPET